VARAKWFGSVTVVYKPVTLGATNPTAQIWEERVFGLVKSFVAYGGFPSA
jgi:hypothetical protein